MSHTTADLQLQKAIEHHRAGRYQQVLRLCRPIVASQPDNSMAHRLVGLALLKLGEARGARQSLERAAKLAPQNPDIHTEIALTWRLQGQMPEAHRAVDQSLSMAPDNDLALGTKAELLLLEGRDDDAWKLLEPAMRRGELNGSAALAFARLCPRLDRAEEGIRVIRSQLQNFGLAPAVRMQLLFHLGDLLDRQGRTDEAFAALAQANRLASPTYDPDETSRNVDRMIEAWNDSRFADLPRTEIESEVPVFIVGMPRSGTSLVEQIIDAHPQARGGGELLHVYAAARRLEPEHSGWIFHPDRLTKRRLNDEGWRVLEQMQAISSNASRITDKLPLNLLRIGLIRLMLPSARIIHCRRDPMDVGFSCFKQLFGAPLAWSYDLVHIGRMIHDMDRLMAHWTNTLRVPILDVQYESLVDAPEVQTRRIIDFIGLPWDETCLKFHESGRLVITASSDQVRKPIYKSAMKRYERYGAHLDPLRRAIAGDVP